MGARLMKLFILIPDYKWWSLALRFGEFVEEVWDEYDGDRLEELYNSITASKEDYLRVYQERLAKVKWTPAHVAEDHESSKVARSMKRTR